MNADVLVCTPARLLRLIKDEWVLLGRLAHVIVDEADEMLTSGFASDVGEILKLTHGETGVNRFGGKVQHIFAAATMREAKPLLDAFPGELEWISTSQFVACIRNSASASTTCGAKTLNSTPCTPPFCDTTDTNR